MLEIVAAVVCAISGVAAAHVVVAESDAHRLGHPDRWWAPRCEQCGSRLEPTLTRCAAEAHRQRRANTVSLVALPILFAALPFVVPSLWVLPAYLVFVGTGVLLTITDIDTKLIPNRILVRGGGLSAVALVVGSLFAAEPGALLRAVAASMAYFGGMLVLALLARGALGFGDVKLAALLGAFTGYLGWGHLAVTAVGSFIIAGLVALVLLVFRRATRKDHIPFGPFMVAAAFVAVYFGDLIIDWYQR